MAFLLFTEWQKKDVSSTDTLAAITNLKPGTNYSITVTAIFKSKGYESVPPILVSTRPDNDVKEGKQLCLTSFFL